MTPGIVTQRFQQAVSLAQQGQDAKALNCLEAFLRARPTHGPAWNLAGCLAMKTGQMQKAILAFQKSLLFAHRPKETASRLAEAYLETDQPLRAAGLLNSLQAEDPHLRLKIARRLQEQRDWAGAMEVLQRGKSVSGQAAIFEPVIEELKNQRAKIAFFCGADGPTFLRDIIRYLEERYPVRCFEGSTPQEMAQLMQWSDVSWFEWATNLAQIGSQLPKAGRMIVRLHRYEAYQPWIREIRWAQVDLLITVGNSHVIEALEQWVPDIRQQVPIVRIPNGVNLDSIPFQNRSRGKRIAFVASVRMVKNPMFLLQCMHCLHQIDPEYELFIAGKEDDFLLGQYMRHQIKVLGLEQAVHFDGWIGDIPSWLADKHYLAVTSVIESQGMGVLEAMAAGIKPVIHNFPGAQEIYGSEFLFNTPEDFCQQILSEEYEPVSYREYVEQRYPISRTLIQIDEILGSFEEEFNHINIDRDIPLINADSVCIGQRPGGV
jgi:tetratricopeptide (TPR) repeat protein